MKNKKYISGLSLPIAVILSFAGMGVVFSYYNSLFNEFWIIEYQIAETKAGYMADTGIAESRQYMINENFEVQNTWLGGQLVVKNNKRPLMNFCHGKLPMLFVLSGTTQQTTARFGHISFAIPYLLSTMNQTPCVQLLNVR